MNNTRKEIINLIQDYMDKTLNEDCYVFIDDDLGKNYVKFNPLMEYKPWEYAITSIAWHYDITAVLKYIQNNNNIISYEVISLSDFILLETNLNWNYFEIKIPNKPLHLYTEEEEGNLLKLLERLK